MSTSDVRSAQKDGIRRPKGGVRTLATSTNPAIPNDLIPGQRARTAAEEAIALALKEMPSDQRRALLKELAEEEAPISETKGAA
jgi:DNA-directed RNA polymerase specialized sigma24 family protein